MEIAPTASVWVRGSTSGWSLVATACAGIALWRTWDIDDGEARCPTGPRVPNRPGEAETEEAEASSADAMRPRNLPPSREAARRFMIKECHDKKMPLEWQMRVAGGR